MSGLKGMTDGRNQSVGIGPTGQSNRVVSSLRQGTGELMALIRRHWLALPLSVFQRDAVKNKDLLARKGKPIGIKSFMDTQEAIAREHDDPEPHKIWALYVVTIGGTKPEARQAINKATGLGNIFTTEHPASFFQAFHGEPKKPRDPKQDAYWFPYEIAVSDYLETEKR
jgi:hypothetical protein